MFDGNFNVIKNVTMISTTPLSEVMTTSTTTIGTLGAITDPELVRFQNELDRRYFNLNKKEEVKVNKLIFVMRQNYHVKYFLFTQCYR